MTTPEIRPFANGRANRLLETLYRNGQYDYPDVEGPAAMRRSGQRDTAVVLVAESGGQVHDLVRAVYVGLPRHAVTPDPIGSEVTVVTNGSPWRIDA
jgi:hypothetical protein